MRSLLVLVLSAALFACDYSNSSDDAMLDITVSRASAETNSQFSVRLRNSSQQPLFLTACGDLVILEVERQMRDGWKPHQSRGKPCLAIFSGLPQKVDVGEAVSSTLTIRDVGIYRLRVHFAVERNENYQNVVSESFQVMKP